MGTYLIRLQGDLSDDLRSRFPSLQAGPVRPASPTTDAPAHAETTMCGPLRDQGALLGVLDHLDMLGVGILEVRRLAEVPGRSDADAMLDRRDGGAGHSPLVALR
jgi:hypothetical protein